VAIPLACPTKIDLQRRLRRLRQVRATPIVNQQDQTEVGEATPDKRYLSRFCGVDYS
jgi:hypothetical protein